MLEFSTYLGGQGFENATAIAVDSANNVYIAGYTELADFFKTNPGANQFASKAGENQDVFLVKLDGKTKQIAYIDFIGGTGYDAAWSVAVDSDGAAVIVGNTLSTDFPRRNPYLLQPQFIDQYLYGFATRVSPDGASLVWSTYTAIDADYGVALTSTGSAYIVGGTECLAGFVEFFPTADAAQRTCDPGDNGEVSYGYILRLGKTGGKEYATYFVPAGGAGHANGISDAVVDAQDNLYITGTTVGTSYLLRPDGGFGLDDDCYVAKFNRSGQVLWTQRLSGERDEEGLRIAADSSGNVYVTGYTTSQSFPVTTGAFQPKNGSSGQIPNLPVSFLGDAKNRPLFEGFVAKFSSSGDLRYNSYLGGNGDDVGIGIAADSSGRAYVTGYTNSQDFHVTPGAYQTAFGGGQADAFLAVVSADGSRMEQASFFGGKGKDEGYQVALDRDGNLWLAGGTESPDLPLTPDALGSAVRGAADAFVAKLNLSTCDVRLTGLQRTVPSAAGTISADLAASAAGCAWNLASLSSWIQVTPAQGTGAAKITLTVSRNSTSDPRLGMVAVNGKRTFLYQDGQAACRFVITPGELSFPSASERRQVSIQASDSTCAWTAQPDQGWLRILSAAGGTGSGTITVTADQNDGGASRTGTIAIGSQKVGVGQSAGQCTITLSSETGEFSPAGGLGSVRVLTSADQCAWNAQSKDSWITILSGDSGYGNGRVHIGVAHNTAAQPRTGTITVGNGSFTVTQEQRYVNFRDDSSNYGSSGTGTSANALQPMGRLGGPVGAASRRQPSLSNGDCGSQKPGPLPIKLDPTGAQVAVTVTRPIRGCQVVARSNSSWLTVTVDAQSAYEKTATIYLSATANPNSQARNGDFALHPGDISLDWPSISVQQDGAVKPLALQSQVELPPAADKASIDVNTVDQSPCNWSVTNTPESWIKPANTSGPCGTPLEFSYDANPSASSRTATIRFNTQDQVQIVQDPAQPPCTFGFKETGVTDVPAGGGSVTLNVTAASGCAWFATTNHDEWVSFPQGQKGTGPGPLVLNIAGNDTASQRVAGVSVDQTTVYVREDAVLPKTCGYTLTPTGAAFDLNGGSGSFQVQTTADCTWQASVPASASWVKIASGASGTGTGTVAFTVDANPMGSPARSANIGVSGNGFAITQDAGPPAQSSISASPNPITACNAQGLGKTMVTWSTNVDGTIQVRNNAVDGSLFASGKQGSQETGEWFSTPANLFLVNGGTILAQTTVTTTCVVTPKPTGTLAASPNPIPACSAQDSVSVTLTWTTANVTAVEVHKDTFDGPRVASGGASGSVTVPASPGNVFLLVNTSGGTVPSTDGVLARVSVGQGSCPQTGVAPPTTDLAETIADWTFEGDHAQDIQDPQWILSGARSLYFESFRGSTIRVARTIPAGGWDLSKIKALTFSVITEVPPGRWQPGSPSVRLTSANGSVLLAPGSEVARNSSFDFVTLAVPLAGDATWRATQTGQFDLKSVTKIEIGFETTVAGWAMILDGVFLK